MANSTMGSHGGSFAGGFIKSFLAVAQMAMRKRQLDDMHAFYGMMMKQMQANMAHTQLDDDMKRRFMGEINPWKGTSYENLSEGDKSTFQKFKNNIDAIEGGKPDTVTPVTHKDGTKDAALGTHQILESNLPDWGKKYAGIDGLTRDKFLASPEIQDKIFDGMLKDNVAQYGYANTASRYFTGKDYGPGNTDTQDKNKTTNTDYVHRALDGVVGSQASAIDTRDSSNAKTFLASLTDHPDRPGDTSNMKPEFATRLASAIKQANAEGIPARVGSGYRDADQLLRSGDRSKAAYFDASGQSKHTDGTASDVGGIGQPGSRTAERWAEIANANGLSVPYGYDNAKEWNHTELAGETRVRGAQPANAARTMVAGPGAPSDTAPPIPTAHNVGSGAYLVAQAEEKEKEKEKETSTTPPLGNDQGTPNLGGGVTQPPIEGTPTPPTTAPAIPIGGGAGNVLTQAPGGPQLPNQATPAAAPAAIPSRGAPQPPLGPAPGTIQYQVPNSVGARAPIYTVGNFGNILSGGQPAPVAAPQPRPVAAPPAPAVPTTTGTVYPVPPRNPNEGNRPQQVPPTDAPLPPRRPDDLSGATDTSGAMVPGASQDTASATGTGPGSDPLWAGYAGASPDQAAAADPLNSLYASGENFSSSAGLTDTSGLMSAGMMDQLAMADEPDLTAEMYRGGPVIRYVKGGDVNEGIPPAPPPALAYSGDAGRRIVENPLTYRKSVEDAMAASDASLAAKGVKVPQQAFSTTPEIQTGIAKGGVIRRYAQGGDTDDGDLLSEYGGTDTEDPMANAYWDQQRVNAQLTNNSEGAPSGPDLTTSIQNRAMQPSQGDAPIALPPNPLESTTIGEPPASAQPAPTTEQPAAAPTEQPAAPASEDTTAPQPTSQSDIPPGSVQVAGPGGWGSVRSGGEYTHIGLPRVGGMGGMGGGHMPRPSMSALTGGRGGRVANVGRLGNQPLYVPSNAGDEDYNHLGIAPVHNSDGTPSVWLLNMLDNGIRSLFTGFGLANQGAIPGSPESKDNLIAFGQHSGVTKEDMTDLGDFYDPKHQLYEGGRDIAGAVGMIKYYALTGQLDAASRLSGGVLLYTRMMSMQYGDQAVKDLFGGDYKNAVKSLEKGYNWVPDAKTAEATEIDPKTGKVHAVQKDGNGKVIAEQDYLPAAIMKAALGLKDGTGFWNMLSSVARAGGNDPMGSHYETQRLLRGIQGNQNVPPGPLADQAAPKDNTIPIGNTPPAPPDTTITSPDTTQPTPDTTPDTTTPPTTAPDNSTVSAPPATVPPIPDRNVGPNVNVGQVAPPLTAQPAQAMATRSDIVPPNLVAGPGASSTIQPTAEPVGGSGAALVAQEKARAEQVKQSQAIDRMVHGGQFDGDDPYVQQKITDIQNRHYSKLQAQRSAMEQQYADVEGADISPAEKRSLQVALAAKIKNFDETSMKPAITAAKQEYSQFASGLKQQFQAKMAIKKRQEKLEDEALTQEKGQIAGQVKYREPRNMDDEQFNLIDGIDKSGRQIIDPSTNERIYGFGDALNMPPEAVRSVATGVDANGKTTSSLPIPVNPLVSYSLKGNPYLSSSYDGKDASTFNFHDIKTPEGEPLYTSNTVNTMVDASKDILKYDKGVDARMVKDMVTGVATGNYKIRLDPFNMPHSILVTHDMAPDVVDKNQRVIPSDNVERMNVTISRGDNDPGTTVVMSKANAFKLQALRFDAARVAEYNKGMLRAKSAPLDRPIPTVEDEAVRPPPRSSNVPVPIPPRGPKWNQPFDLNTPAPTQ